MCSVSIPPHSGPKQLCALVHLGCTRKVGTSKKLTFCPIFSDALVKQLVQNVKLLNQTPLNLSLVTSHALCAHYVAFLRSMDVNIVMMEPENVRIIAKLVKSSARNASNTANPH